VEKKRKDVKNSLFHPSSSVNIVATLWASIPGRGDEVIFCLRNSVQTGSGAHLDSLMGTESSFPGVKRPGRKDDHSPLSSGEVNAWSFTSTPSWCLVKHRYNFTFTFRIIKKRDVRL
jgi:hypothetical protein